MNGTTKRSGRAKRSRAPSFGDLLAAAGKTPAMIEVEARVSMATVYRARRGVVPGALHLAALAAALGVTEAECRAAIERSRGAA